MLFNAFVWCIVLFPPQGLSCRLTDDRFSKVNAKRKKIRKKKKETPTERTHRDLQNSIVATSAHCTLRPFEVKSRTDNSYWDDEARPGKVHFAKFHFLTHSTLTDRQRPSIKPGTRNTPEHPGTWKNNNNFHEIIYIIE